MLKRIIEHVINNKREYILITLIFIIGIFLGVMFINNTSETQVVGITEYFENFIEKLKATESLETFSLLKRSILNNFILALSLWFFGTTVIRNSNCFWNSFV